MVHEIVMDGPRKNALGTGMLQFVLDELHRAAGAPVLLTGKGDAFSAGLDLGEVAALDGERARTFLALLERCISELYLYPGPTVAAVNGHAIAGGCVFTVCCDHRVAVDNPGAKIGLNEVPLGLRFPPRTLAVVRARLSRRHVTRVLLGGGLFAPAEAERLGLVDEVAADPRAVARRRIEELAASPRESYARTKRDLRGSTAQELASDAALDVWMQESIGVWTSAEVKQKIAAALRR